MTEIFKVCRGCMEKSNLQSLFSGNIPDLFYNLTSVHISHDDGLPLFICSTCVSQLLNLSVFKQQCINSDIVLKTKLINTQTLSSVNSNEFHLQKKVILNEETSPRTLKQDDETNLGSIPHLEENIVWTEELLIAEVGIDTLGIESQDVANNKLEIDAEESEEEGNYVGDGDSIDRKSKKQVVLSDKSKKQKLLKPYIPKKLSKDYDPRKNYKFPFRCQLCNRGFRYKERLDGHLREHDGKRAAVCEFCGREYTKWSGLQQHMQHAHHNEMKYVCYCGKTFMYESALVTHKITHTEPRVFICETCGKPFPDQYQLNKHYLAHTTETPYECDQCNKKFKSDFHLRAHQFRHKGIRNFTCQTCGKSVATRPELRSHMLVHSQDKPFQCTICGKFFRHKSQVASHTRTHTGDKPYRCVDCGKCFTCLNSLKIHKRVHTGEKPFRCAVCDRAFAQGSVLKTHMKVHNLEREAS